MRRVGRYGSELAEMVAAQLTPSRVVHELGRERPQQVRRIRGWVFGVFQDWALLFRRVQVPTDPAYQVTVLLRADVEEYILARTLRIRAIPILQNVVIIGDPRVVVRDARQQRHALIEPQG
jgi:hypothetical protein